MTPDTSGLLFTLPLLTWDPASLCWRTSGVISRSGSTGSSVTLPTSGMTRSGELFEHPTWGAAISAPASSLLPTPNTMDGMAARSDEALARAKQSGGCSNLKDVIPRLLPTPVKGDGERGSQTYSRGNPTLRGALLPTPRAQNGEPRNQTPYLRPLTDPQNLKNAEARMLPTPTARLGDSRGAQAKRYLNPERSNDLDDAVKWLDERTSAPTPPQSAAKSSGTDPHPTQLPTDA